MREINLQVRVGRGRDAEADAARRSLLREEHFQLGAEQVRGKTELATLFIKDGYEIVR